MLGPSLLTLRKGVIELVGVFAIIDLDRHCAGDANQLIGSRVWHHADLQLWGVTRHDAGMVQREASLAALQGPGDTLDSYINARAFHGGGGGEHFTPGGRFQIAVILLVDGHPAQAGVGGLVGEGFGRDLYVERSGSVLGQTYLLLLIRAG